MALLYLLRHHHHCLRERLDKASTKFFFISGEIGDVVVGRITEVQQKRWKVDINCRLDAGKKAMKFLCGFWDRTPDLLC